MQQNRPHALTVRQPSTQQKSTQPQIASLTTRIPPPVYRKSNAIAMTEAVSLPLGVPAFRRIPSSLPSVESSSNNINSQAQNTFNRKVMPAYSSLSQVHSFFPVLFFFHFFFIVHLLLNLYNIVKQLNICSSATIPSCSVSSTKNCQTKCIYDEYH